MAPDAVARSGRAGVSGLRTGKTALAAPDPEEISMRVLGMIMAGGEGKRLFPPTAERAKPAVPFAGKHRIADRRRYHVSETGITVVPRPPLHPPETPRGATEGQRAGLGRRPPRPVETAA